MIGKQIRMGLATALVATMAVSPWSFASGPVVSGTAAETGIFHGRANLPSASVDTVSENFVALVADSDGAVYRSEALQPDGSFIVEAPVGSYSVLAGTPAAAYLADQSVQVSEGVNPAVAIRINGKQDPGEGGAGGAGGGGMGGWGTWLIVGAIAVAAYFVLDDVTEDLEEDASPF